MGTLAAHAQSRPGPAPSILLTMTTVEKRPSTDGLVDNVDPRESTEFEMEELPTYEKPAEPAPVSLKDKLITCFWISVNTLSTLGLIFLSKRYVLAPCRRRIRAPC